MNKIAISCFFFLLNLTIVAQSNSNKRLSRVVNRIAKVNVFMWGSEAEYLDKEYQVAKHQPIDAEWGRVRVDRVRRAEVSVREWNDPTNYNSSYNEFVFYQQQRKYQVRHFRDMADLATEEDLLKLTEHSNGVVRCYAFWALLEQQYPKSFDILLKHLTDNERIKTLDDKDIRIFKVGDLFIELMTKDQIAYDLLAMNAEETRRLGRILAEDPNITLEARFDWMNDLELTKDNYNVIRQTAMTQKEPRTIVKLAQYQRGEDVELIGGLFEKTGKYYALKASRNFPDKAFFGGLQAFHEEQLTKKKDINERELNMLYQALVQYRDDASKKMLEESLGIKKKWINAIHQKAIWLALHKYPHSTYNSIKNSLTLDNYDKRKALKSLEE